MPQVDLCIFNHFKPVASRTVGGKIGETAKTVPSWRDQKNVNQHFIESLEAFAVFVDRGFKMHTLKQVFI